MASYNRSDTSSEEDDYFENLRTRTKRKLDLEQEIAAADDATENLGRSTSVDLELTLNDPMDELSILPSVPSTVRPCHQPSAPSTELLPATDQEPKEIFQIPDSSFSSITDTQSETDDIPLTPAIDQEFSDISSEEGDCFENGLKQETSVDVEMPSDDPMDEPSASLQPSVPSTEPDNNQKPPENVPTPESSFPTITDTLTETDDFPLIPASNQAKKSRLITNITEVIKPVAKLVITINADSETEDETEDEIIRDPAVHLGSEKNRQLFSSSISQQQGRSAAITSSETATESCEQNKTAQVAPTSAQAPTPIDVNPQQQQMESTSSPASPPAVSASIEPNKKLDKVKQSLAKVAGTNLAPEGKERLVVNAEKVYRIHSEKLMNATQESIKWLEENEADMKKQEAYKLMIAEFEEILRKYKSSLSDVDQKVKENMHKILQSQRTMIKKRIHQKNFGEVLQKIGTMARGDTYRVAQHVSPQENFHLIVAGTERLMRSSDDQAEKERIKVIAERVKSFVSAPAGIIANKPDNECANECAKENHSKAPEITAKPRNGFDDDDKEPEMQQENSTMQATEEEELPGTQESNKRSLQSATKDQIVAKKLKYGSPLESIRQSN